MILDLHGERMHTLNPTAAFIFREIDGKHSAQDIWEAVVSFFDVQPRDAQRDTLSLLAQLHELRIIE